MPSSKMVRPDSTNKALLNSHDPFATSGKLIVCTVVLSMYTVASKMLMNGTYRFGKHRLSIRFKLKLIGEIDTGGLVLENSSM